MNYIPVSYRTKLKELHLKHIWIDPRRVKPMPGHINLIARLLAMCESAMGTLSPEFSVFHVRYLGDRMKITAIPAPGSKCDSLALRQAIGLTLNEARIVCPYCGNYQATPQSLEEEVYVCCAASGDIALWEAIPDLMVANSDKRSELFDAAIKDISPTHNLSLNTTSLAEAMFKIGS